MSKELNYFDEKTILSTPNPISSSSMSSESHKKKNNHLEVYTGRLSDVENSLGILSLKSDDISLHLCHTKASAHLSKERQKAFDSLKEYSAKMSELTSLPSRFLRRSEVSEGSASDQLHSDSTISERDLLPGDSSTPRQSLLSNLEYVRKERQSFGQSISCLANSISKNPHFDLSKLADEVRKTIDPEGTFRSGEEAIAKLEEDELSWQREKDIPAQLKEFSTDNGEDFKLSMGSFFKQRSDDLSKVLPKSPKKSQPPIPLLETSTCSTASGSTSLSGGDSLSISHIAQILSEQTPNRALDYLLNTKKNAQKVSPNNSDSVRESKGKENVDSLNVQEENVENISPDFHHEKSALSVRSTSSLSSLPNGKLPMATTKTEIIWGCIKPGRNNSQDFIIRNRSSSRLGIQCSVSNPSFRLIKEGSELNFSSMIKVVLQPYESRTLSVTFAPTTLGAAVDNLNFTSIDPNHKQTVKQFIRLYGYGGYGNIVIQKIIKDTTGKYLMSLGNVDTQQEMKQAFVLKNVGTLPSFAYIYFIPNGLYSFSPIEFCPQRVVLLPGQDKEVAVLYNVPKKDFSYIKSKINGSVIDVGKLHMIHGTEVDRGRLRKLCLKAKERGQEIKESYYDITAKFTDEVMASDLKYLRESVGSVEEIVKFLNNEEIIVTIEQDVDHTITGQLQDETMMFHSLCENTNIDAFGNTTYRDTCHVEPSRIILTPPNKIKDMIFLTNNNKKILYFEASSTPEGLNIRPKDGTIRPGETLLIEVSYTKYCNDKTVFKVRILVDNESFEVDVKIIFVNRVE
jgi:hypothetical protein